MPEICRFYGIVIKIYFGDHLPPHFHAEYGAQEALLHIDTLAVIAGKTPTPRYRLGYGVGLVTSGRVAGGLEKSQEPANAGKDRSSAII